MTFGEVARDERRDRRVGRRAGLGAIERGEDFTEGLVEGGDDQIVLGLEIPVEAAVREAGPIHDVGDTRALDAPLADHARGPLSPLGLLTK